MHNVLLLEGCGIKERNAEGTASHIWVLDSQDQLPPTPREDQEGSWCVLSTGAAWHSFCYRGSVFAYMCTCVFTMTHVWELQLFFFSLNHINPSSQVGDPVGKITGAFITCRGGISSYNDSLVIWHHFPPHIHSERQVFKEGAEYPRGLIAVFKAHSWHSKTSCRTRDFLAPELLPFSLLLGAASWWDVESK